MKCELHEPPTALQGQIDGNRVALHQGVHDSHSFVDRSFQLAISILRLYRKLTAMPEVPRYLANQLLRAGTSIGANLREAQSAYSRRDMAARQSIALREARECEYWLLLLAEDEPSLAREVRVPLDEVRQFIAMLVTSVRKLQKPLPPA